MGREKKAKEKDNRAFVFITAVVFLGSCMMGIPACSKQVEAPKQSSDAKPTSSAQPPANTDSRSAQKASSASEPIFKSITPVHSYEPAGKPDPFSPLIQEEYVSIKPPSDASRDLSALPPLQRYDVSEFTLVAIVSKNNNVRAAMVEDKSGYGYILKKGMHIGRHDGAIQEITQDSVVISEKIADSSGNLQTKTTTLRINKSESGER